MLCFVVSKTTTNILEQSAAFIFKAEQWRWMWQQQIHVTPINPLFYDFCVLTFTWLVHFLVLSCHLQGDDTKFLFKTYCSKIDHNKLTCVLMSIVSGIYRCNMVCLLKWLKIIHVYIVINSLCTNIYCSFDSSKIPSCKI